jgi:hypothetical protein
MTALLPHNKEERMAWTLLGAWSTFEYWLAPDGDTVVRRKVSSYNYLDAVNGSPVGARYESTLAHFERFVAGVLPV